MKSPLWGFIFWKDLLSVDPSPPLGRGGEGKSLGRITSACAGAGAFGISNGTADAVMAKRNTEIKTLFRPYETPTFPENALQRGHFVLSALHGPDGLGGRKAADAQGG